MGCHPTTSTNARVFYFKNCTMQHEFTGVFIPAHIWLSPDLSPAEKMMLGEVDALSKRSGWCTAGRQHFATWLHCTLPNITYYTRRLEDMGFLEIMRDAGGSSKMRVVGARFYENLQGSKDALLVNTVNGGSKPDLRVVVNTVNGGSKPSLPEIQYKENKEIQLKNNNAQSAFPLSENESDYVKIEIRNAETEFEQFGTINPNNPKQDTPGGGGASAQQYGDTDADELRRRDPKPARGKKQKSEIVEPPRGMSMADFVKPIDRLNKELQERLNMPGRIFARLNADGNLKKLKDLYDKAKTAPDEAAEVVAYIVGKWVGGKCQDNLTPDTLFRASNFTRYRGWYEMSKAAPAQNQPRRERLRMDEPDFSTHGGEQFF